jgi:uncharacterized cofD-like protein
VGGVPSVVVIGGGHGCARSLAALRLIEVRRSAVVSVADDGGSSGRLRRDHDVVALGDLRMALLALAGHDERLAALARRRFARGELAGHSLGNLLLLGLLEEHDGDLLAALGAFGAMVGTVGEVLPSTTTPVTLSARTAQGEVEGQVAVATATRIRRVRIEPDDAPAAPGVLAVIHAADLVLLGPGSLYTSILPVLLVAGISEALAATSARVVLVGNMRAQPGETEGMDLADHVEALLDHRPDLRIDTLLAHEPDPSGPGSRAGRHHHAPLAIDLRRIGRRVGEVVRADLGDELDGHDPRRLAGLIETLIGPGAEARTAG